MAADTGLDGRQLGTTRDGAAIAALRIISVNPTRAVEAFGAASELGFSHVLLSSAWLGAGLNAHPADGLEAPAAASPLGELAQAAARNGVALLTDTVLDRMPVQLGTADTPFSRPDRGGLLDPRKKLLADVALARLDGPEDVAALAGWWAGHLQAWHAVGVAGFRLVGLQAIPDTLVASFFAALRAAVPDAILLAWTPGMSRQAVLALRGRGADGVFASLPWWDGRADWFWDELDDLLSVGPVLGLDGVPPGSGHPGQARSVAPGLAAFIGQGWLHVPVETETADVTWLNDAIAAEPALSARVRPVLPTGDAGPVLSLLRSDAAEHRSATRAALAVVNTDASLEFEVGGAALLTACGGAFATFRDASGVVLTPGIRFALPPGQAMLFTASARPPVAVPLRVAQEAAAQAASSPRLAIEQPSPCVDAGRFPVKAVAGDTLQVAADIVFDGHEKIAAALRWRSPGEDSWTEARMQPLGNDRWAATMPLAVIGRHEYVVMAWRDRFETFRDELAKKSAAGLRVALELAEGETLVREASARTEGAPLRAALPGLATGDEATRVRAFLDDTLAAKMAAADDRPFMIETAAIPVDAERMLARFASWYEVFPRSMSDDPARHGTFADVERHLPRVRDMGFDVLYFPPISPIGRKNRKGRNNTLTPAADDPGSPYAVGSEDGGHDALHPELGTLEDFQHLQRAAAAHGLEIAIDFAIQCSPDHPWLKQHKGWFDWRPDGSIKYAENPPKKYEDIVNVDFYGKDAVPGLWAALCDVVLFWAEHGIRIFRVDNPHTKPFPFWEWMIREVRTRYPDAMFLAEAFTRPKIMYRLAKIGFSQSYTYFTWRNEKAELVEYLTELNETPARDFFRPHFFVNTPDINPVFLQGSGRSGFLIRAALAATLSGLFGVYSGFELCEAAAVPGKEEYLDSEKYQLRAWDWDRPGNIVAEITSLNRIRRRNPALQSHLGVRFLPSSSEHVLFFEKATPDRSNVVLVAISLDPKAAHETDIELPLWSWRISDDGPLGMQDLLSGTDAVWRGNRHRLRLTPDRPYAIWRARPTP